MFFEFPLTRTFHDILTVSWTFLCFQNDSQNFTINTKVYEQALTVLKVQFKDENFYPLFVFYSGGELVVDFKFRNRVSKVYSQGLWPSC